MFNFQMVPLDDDYNSLFSNLYTLVSVSTESDPQPKMRATKDGGTLVVFVPNSRGNKAAAHLRPTIQVPQIIQEYFPFLRR